MPDWTCRCSAKNGESARYCEGCGTENPRPVRALKAVPTALPETHRPWSPPADVVPATDEQVREAFAKIRAILGMPPRQADADTQSPPERPSRLGLTIDPAIRAELERRAEPVGAVLGRVMPRREGA